MITVDFKRLGIKPGFRILDIGCGSGRHTGAAIKYDAVSAVGVDINYTDVCETRERLKLQEKWGETAGTWEIMVADTTCLPFRNNFFDLIICSEVLEHIRDQQAAINELVRILKPGKNMAVSVPRYWPEKICWKLSEEYRTTEGGHLRIYKQKVLSALLEKAGLQQWAAHWAHSVHTPYWWLKCLVGPSRNDAVPVNLYHRFLTWHIMKNSRLANWLDYLLNPVLGKSVVLYLRKKDSRGLGSKGSSAKA
ncbi:class I SAM-dependent methyltransferase [Thermodesulfobacteriota bacterium]